MHLHGPVRSYMTPDVAALSYDAPVSQARALLRAHAFHHIPIVDDGRVVGILSATDIARISLESWGTDIATVDAHLDAHFTLPEIMTLDPALVEASSSIHEAAEILAEGLFHALPVVDNGKLVGMITTTDLLRAFLAT